MSILQMFEIKTMENIVEIEKILKKRLKGKGLSNFRNKISELGTILAIKNLFYNKDEYNSQAISLLALEAFETNINNLRNYLMLTAEYTILQNPFYNLFEHGILFSAKKRLLDLKFPFSQQEIANIETILNNNIIKIDDPGENLPEESYFEGAGKQITVNRYERNGEARLACLEIHGYECTICGFNFENRYGEIGKDYIQVHHIESIASKNGEEYEINPETDLIPVCPNCHAMLHRKTPPFNTEELKQILLGNK